MRLVDKAQQKGRGGTRQAGRLVAWLRRLAGETGRRGHGDPAAMPRLDLLGRLIDGSALPDGVVELVIEDAHLSRRHLFGVRDGEMVAIEPGSVVPWTSIRGSQDAWKTALGPERDASQLHHTGEPRLAEGVLAGLERGRSRHNRDSSGYSALDCS